MISSNEVYLIGVLDTGNQYSATHITIILRTAQGVVAFSEIACLEVWRNARKPQRLTFVKQIEVQDIVFPRISVV